MPPHLCRLEQAAMEINIPKASAEFLARCNQRVIGIFGNYEPASLALETSKPPIKIPPKALMEMLTQSGRVPDRAQLDALSWNLQIELDTIFPLPDLTEKEMLEEFRAHRHRVQFLQGPKSLADLKISLRGRLIQAVLMDRYLSLIYQRFPPEQPHPRYTS